MRQHYLTVLWEFTVNIKHRVAYIQCESPARQSVAMGQQHHSNLVLVRNTESQTLLNQSAFHPNSQMIHIHIKV